MSKSLSLKDVQFIDDCLSNKEERYHQQQTQHELDSQPGFSDSWDYRAGHGTAECSDQEYNEDGPRMALMVQYQRGTEAYKRKISYRCKGSTRDEAIAFIDKHPELFEEHQEPLPVVTPVSGHMRNGKWIEPYCRVVGFEEPEDNDAWRADERPVRYGRSNERTYTKVRQTPLLAHYRWAWVLVKKIKSGQVKSRKQMSFLLHHAKLDKDLTTEIRVSIWRLYKAIVEKS